MKCIEHSITANMDVLLHPQTNFIRMNFEFQMKVIRLNPTRLTELTLENVDQIAGNCVQYFLITGEVLLGNWQILRLYELLKHGKQATLIFETRHGY